jgi:S1-C subfamily serine protease
MLAHLTRASRWIRIVTWVNAGLAAIAVALALSGCAPAVRSPLVQVTRWPLFEGRPHPAHCSGFAVQADQGVRIMTAAHCVTGYALGERVPVVTRDTWERTSRGVEWATLEAVDGGGDVATLRPDDAATGRLEALPLARRAPRAGEPVRLLSGRYWTESRGEVEGRYWADVEGLGAAERWACSATIEPGWSGSAVLDASGAVLGVVTSCKAVQNATGAVECQPGFAAFQGVP